MHVFPTRSPASVSESGVGLRLMGLAATFCGLTRSLKGPDTNGGRSLMPRIRLIWLGSAMPSARLSLTKVVPWLSKPADILQIRDRSQKVLELGSKNATGKEG